LASMQPRRITTLERRKLQRAAAAHERARGRVDEVLLNLADSGVRLNDLGASLGGIGKAGISERLRRIRDRARAAGGGSTAGAGFPSDEAEASRGSTSELDPGLSGERGAG